MISRSRLIAAGTPMALVGALTGAPTARADQCRPETLHKTVQGTEVSVHTTRCSRWSYVSRVDVDSGSMSTLSGELYRFITPYRVTRSRALFGPVRASGVSVGATAGVPRTPGGFVLVTVARHGETSKIALFV